MSLQDLVNVTITANTVSPTRPGFGTPLVATYHDAWTDRARKYSSLAALVSDGFPATSKTYQAISVLLSQNPSVAGFYVGRRALSYTQTVQLLLSSSSALDTYGVKMVGWDGVAHQFTLASTGTPATDAASLVTAINAATMSPVTSAGTSPPVVTLSGAPTANEQIVIAITTGGAGTAAVFKWSHDGGVTYTTGVSVAATVALGSTGLTAHFTVSGSDTYSTDNVYTANSTLGFASAVSATVTVTQIPGQLVDFQNWDLLNNHIISLTDATADPGIATDIAAINAAIPKGSWYGLALDSNSSAEIQAAAGWTESNGAHLFFCSNSDAGDWNSSSTTDVFAELKSHAFTRTFCLFSGTQLLTWSGLGALGKLLPQNPGSATLAYKTLASVQADNLTDSQQSNLQAKNGNYYVTIAGINVISGQFGGGISGAGEFIDIAWGIDWLQSSIQIDVFALLAGNLKVPYTDQGASMIHAVVQKDLNLATTPAFNFLASNPAPVCTVPRVATVDGTDVAQRNLPNVTFSGTLAGAIHTLQISGVLVLP